jgi:hypothetical protein
VAARGCSWLLFSARGWSWLVVGARLAIVLVSVVGSGDESTAYHPRSSHNVLLPFCLVMSRTNSPRQPPQESPRESPRQLQAQDRRKKQRRRVETLGLCSLCAGLGTVVLFIIWAGWTLPLNVGSCHAGGVIYRPHCLPAQTHQQDSFGVPIRPPVLPQNIDEWIAINNTKQNANGAWRISMMILPLRREQLVAIVFFFGAWQTHNQRYVVDDDPPAVPDPIIYFTYTSSIVFFEMQYSSGCLLPRHHRPPRQTLQALFPPSRGVRCARTSSGPGAAEQQFFKDAKAASSVLIYP